MEREKKKEERERDEIKKSHYRRGERKIEEKKDGKKGG